MTDPDDGAPPSGDTVADRSFGNERDWLLRFAPPAQTAALAALFTVEHEVLASLRPGLEHQVAHLRLEWWQEELARLATGRPRHPSTRALADSARARSASPADLTGLIDHVRIDLATVAFADRGELDTHLGNWGRSVFREAALGNPQVAAGGTPAAAAAERLAAGAGAAVRELELLADFSWHARAGRIYTPLDAAAAPHTAWTVTPLGAAERALLERRAAELYGLLRAAAHAVDAAYRPALRVPLLWMGHACVWHIAAADPTRAPYSPLRRTIGTWRDALAINRGGLPRALR